MRRASTACKPFPVNSEGGQVKGPTVVSVVSGQLCATVVRITCMMGQP